MIIVTGATGKLGEMIVERLLTKVAPDSLGLSVRDPGKAAHWQARGVRVRQGDFADPASLRHAFEGAAQVLLISSNSSGEAAVTHHRNAIDAAKQAGAQRILYTSHMGANHASAFAPMRDHAATEDALAACGVAYTSLRNGFYAESAVMMMGPFLQTGQVIAPQDGPVSWTDHRDLAEAAVMALTEPEKLQGITPALTGTEALTLAQLAAIAAELTGREISRVTVTDAQNAQSSRSRGTPEHLVELFDGLFKASRAHEFAAIDPTLARLLGRAPLSMSQVLREKLTG